MRVCDESKLQTPAQTPRLQSLDQNQPIRREVLAVPYEVCIFLMNQSGRAFQNLDPFVLEFSISSKLAFFYLFIYLFIYLYFFLPRTKMVRVEIGVLNRRYLACRISAIKFAKCARSRDFFTLIAANCQ